jgi:hypothetical protein
MTEQKPPGMTWEDWTEELVRRAREEGEFSRLPGAGKPLPGIGEPYDPDWWVKKLMQREQVSLLPPSLELLRKVESELAKIGTLGDERLVRARIEALNREIAKVNARAAEGPPTRLGTLNVDEVVAEWRARRAAARPTARPHDRRA